MASGLERNGQSTEIDPQESRNQLSQEASDLNSRDSRRLQSPSGSERSSNSPGSGQNPFNETNVALALKKASDAGLPLIAVVTKDGKLSAADQEAMKAHANDAVFVKINNQNANQMRTRGMASADFWALSNLSGAKSDLNNIKDGFVGRFDPKDFSRNNPQAGLRPEQASGVADFFSSKDKDVKQASAAAGDAQSPLQRTSATTSGDAQPSVRQASVEGRDAARVRRASGASDAPVFDQSNVLAAVDAAKANGKPILEMNVSSGGLDTQTKQHIDTLKNDYNVVLIDKSKSAQMMSQGLPTKEFWTLANLMGAQGDVNRISDKHVGIFSPQDLENSGSKSGMKASKEGADLKSVLPPVTINDSKPKDNSAEKQIDKPQVKPFPNVPDIRDGFDFHQPERKPAQPAIINDGFDFHQPARKPDAQQNNNRDKTDKDHPNKTPDKPSNQNGTNPGGENVRPSNQTPKPQDNSQPKENLDNKKPKPESDAKVEPVKLPKVSFGTNDMEEAVKLAQKHNLPIVFYRGADFCGHCPAVSHAVDQLAGSLNNAPKTDAIVVKLNWEQGQQIKQSNPKLAAMIDKIMPLNGCTFPDVKVYNPNDLSKPLTDSNRDPRDQAFLRSLVQIGKAAMEKQAAKPNDSGKPNNDQPKPIKPLPPRPDAKPQPATDNTHKTNPSDLQTTKPQEKTNPSDQTKETKLEKIRFNESEFSKAVELARKNHLPLVVYTGATWCGPCHAASPKLEAISTKMAAEKQTKAIIVKLDYDSAASLAAQGDANGRMLATVLNQGSSIPRIAVYNPADLESPAANQVVGGISQSGMENYIRSAMDAASKRMK